MRHLLAVGVVALGLAACSSDDGSDAPLADEAADAQPCDELYRDGQPAPDDAADTGCIDEEGDLAYYGLAIEDCTDGRVLQWNDRGWGFEGEDWHTGATLPPDHVMADCTG